MVALADLAGGVTVGVASLADGGVASLADAGVASLRGCWGGVPETVFLMRTVCNCTPLYFLV